MLWPTDCSVFRTFLFRTSIRILKEREDYQDSRWEKNNFSRRIIVQYKSEAKKKSEAKVSSLSPSKMTARGTSQAHLCPPGSPWSPLSSQQLQPSMKVAHLSTPPLLTIFKGLQYIFRIKGKKKKRIKGKCLLPTNKAPLWPGSLLIPITSYGIPMTQTKLARSIVIPNSWYLMLSARVPFP